MQVAAVGGAISSASACVFFGAKLLCDRVVTDIVSYRSIGDKGASFMCTCVCLFLSKPMQDCVLLLLCLTLGRACLKQLCLVSLLACIQTNLCAFRCWAPCASRLSASSLLVRAVL